MNILFLTLVKLKNLNETMVYTDMLRTFAKYGHDVYAISPLERRDKKENYIEEEGNIHLLHNNIGGNYFNVNFMEKGLTLIKLEKGYINGLKKQYKDIKFDLVLYTTPPITFNNVVKYVKKRDDAKSYLMLKDIFPQNAVDIGIMKKKGLKGWIYKYFRRKEKKLYAVSDVIGCMSQANIDYVLQHNIEVEKDRVKLCPNSVIIRDMSTSKVNRDSIRAKYGLPLNKKIFVYGGNIGKPQGIDFLLECLRKVDVDKVLFLIIGDGTEFYKLKEFYEKENSNNVKIMQRLPKEDYDCMVGACDVGMIFLDHRFTIPNFPSRILSYMQAKIPILAVTDPNTDVGKVIEEAEFGWWCESNNSDDFCACIEKINEADLKYLGENGFRYLSKNYDVDICVQNMLNQIKDF